MTVMDYCGVEFTAIELDGGSLWKWQLLIINNDRMQSCGEAPSRAKAISQAHAAIGEGLRANACSDDDARWPAMFFTFFTAHVVFLHLKLSRRYGHF